jgi:probable HAF family extracellular repeat protein
MYRVIDIGMLPGAKETLPRDFNDDGVLVGYSGGRSFLWRPVTGMRKFPPLIEDGSFVPRAIDSHGGAAGFLFYDDRNRPDKPLLIDKEDGSRTFFLEGTWAEPQLYWIETVTASGAILGMSTPLDYGYPLTWVWSPQQGLVPLPDSGDFPAYGMNDHGQLVGTWQIYADERCYADRAFVLDVATGTYTALDGGPADIHAYHCGWYSSAFAINNVGQVAGSSNLRAYGEESRAFVWSASQGRRPLTGDDDRDKHDSKAVDINDAGQVVGIFRRTHSAKEAYFYWDAESGMLDLETLLDPSDPLSADVILQGSGVGPYGWRPHINNKGWIVVTGKRKSLPRDPKGPLPGSDPNRTFVLIPM